MLHSLLYPLVMIVPPFYIVHKWWRMAFTPTSWHVPMPTWMSNLSTLCRFSTKFQIFKDTDLKNGDYKWNFQEFRISFSFSFIIVQVQLPPCSLNNSPKRHPSPHPPLILPLFSFAHMPFKHIPWSPFPFFPW